jgi:16S rRNA (adenine(1408)-N(1))-methyltransferase
MNLRRLQRGDITATTAEALLAHAAGYAEVWFDAGAGDGLFAYRAARERADRLCIALDPVAENLAKADKKAARKASKGGVDNLVLLVGAAEMLPEALGGFASMLTVNYPWGALLRGVAEPLAEVLAPLARLLKPGGRFQILLNQQVFDDTPLRDRLTLPPLTEAHVDERLAAAYEGVGLAITERRLLGDQAPPVRTSWGQRLTLGSGRDTLLICGEARGEMPQ